MATNTANTTNNDDSGLAPTEWQAAADLAGLIPDGCSLALAPDYSGCAMSVIFALVRRRVKGLHLIGVPQLGLQGDFLVASGSVETVESAAVTLGEYGQALNFTRAVQQGRIEIRDSTCPVIHAGLQAAEKHVPFMPLRGILGSDLVKYRHDWRTIQNPFNEDEDPLLLVPAIQPDVALLHAPMADRHGNVWIGIRRELMLMAHASKRTLVSVERIVEGNLLDNPETAAGVIPELYVDQIRVIENGAWPVGLFSEYAADGNAMRSYASSIRSADTGVQEFLDAYPSQTGSTDADTGV